MIGIKNIKDIKGTTGTIIGNKTFPHGRTHIMGILNVTPDSFSDGGRFNAPERAVRHAEKLVLEGADIIDIGGESTRPGYSPVPEAEEIERTADVIRAVKERFDIPVSIDTQKSAVAEAALDAGADMINDIWGFKKDASMARLCAERNAACCLMHNRESDVYNDLISDIVSELAKSAELARAAGIAENKIVLDPGIGFAKTQEQNLKVLNNLSAFDIGYPLLLGASRKSVIGNALSLPVYERLEGTLVTTVLAVLGGYMFVRVHDVRENKRAVKMAEEILNA